MLEVNIIGAGLAGCEAALWLAKKDVKVNLYEQKPTKMSPAHKCTTFAELVCSNSLKSDRADSASGILKMEMELLGSSILPIANSVRVAAGGALAVDREKFTDTITQLIKSTENITVIEKEVTALDFSLPTIVATGPLTEGELADNIAKLTGEGRLFFYDAAAPIITAESINMDDVFAASRYDKGGADYINCPFNKEEYETFHAELVAAESAEQHTLQGEATVYEGCMPIEIMAKRGADTMRYGPLRPVGLVNPKTGHRPWANIQLRREDEHATMYNIVGFQTNLKFGEQKRVFSMIKGLENAEFVRYGVMHRNTFINSPLLLNKTLCLKNNKNICFAGQITGFEGYMESTASGLLAARFLYERISGTRHLVLPETSMCGALLNYITTPNKDFQPMGANIGILPALEEKIKDKRERYAKVSERAIADFKIALQKCE